MAKIHKSITIKAPVEKVFEFMTDPEHLPEIWPSMMEVKNATHTPDGKQSFDWTYKMAGLRFHGHSDTVEAVPNNHVVLKNEKGIPSTFDWHYAKKDGGTEISVDIDYTLPGALMDRLAKPFLTRLNEHEAETLLTNLKDRMEIGEKH